jgi:hypothetical protein
MPDLTEIGLGTLAKTYGPFIAFIAFSLLTGWRRETRCEGRLKALETTIQNSLVSLVNKNTAVVTKNTSLLQRLENLFFKRKSTRKPARRRRQA